MGISQYRFVRDRLGDRLEAKVLKCLLQTGMTIGFAYTTL